jgi:ketosteroid isomerase-like protein
MSHPNEELIRRLYEARERRDEREIRRILSADVKWHDPYPPPFGGHFDGVDAVVQELFAAFENELEGSGLDPHDVVANERHAVALVNWWASRGGRRMDSREVGVYHIENGKVTEVWFMTEDPQRAAEFFS